MLDSGISKGLSFTFLNNGTGQHLYLSESKSPDIYIYKMKKEKCIKCTSVAAHNKMLKEKQAGEDNLSLAMNEPVKKKNPMDIKPPDLREEVCDIDYQTS